MAINKFSITSEYHNISTVSKKIKSFLLKERVDKEISDPILISLMEALNNSIEHSYLEVPGNNIDVIIGISKTKVEVDILETGIARTNFDKPKLQFDPDDLSTAPEGGMGLYIINNLMDSVSYASEKGVNTTSFSKRIK
ncbi:MAG: ATP-binding protein [Melioribacteraceae bacterium]|nr:ATP-binding protein [Melioribacteraceae bacterium]